MCSSDLVTLTLRLLMHGKVNAHFERATIIHTLKCFSFLSSFVVPLFTGSGKHNWKGIWILSCIISCIFVPFSLPHIVYLLNSFQKGETVKKMREDVSNVTSVLKNEMILSSCRCLVNFMYVFRVGPASTSQRVPLQRE